MIHVLGARWRNFLNKEEEEMNSEFLRTAETPWGGGGA